MSANEIGGRIAELRRGKRATQEELARAVGVSTQAVSKWECGGAPDLDLLPGIADFFEVSVDTLFGRSVTQYGDLHRALANDIIERRDEGMRAALEHCWVMQKALFGSCDDGPMTPLAEDANGFSHSQMLFDSGISLMALRPELPYFFLMPEPPDGYADGLPDAQACAEMFALLGAPHILQAILFLTARQGPDDLNPAPFTGGLLEKSLGIPRAEADALLAALVKTDFVMQASLELDDTEQTVYTFRPNPSLLALLALAEAVIRAPTNFRYYCSNRTRPYL